MSTSLDSYLRKLQLAELFKTLGVADPKALAETIDHFTTKEAEERDKIVVSYFGQYALRQIVDSITSFLLTEPKLPASAKLLDLGAGSGFFTIRIAKKTQAIFPKASFYAMDLTPAMLLSLSKKNTGITPFIGLAENIEGSILQARKFLNIPLKFDAVFSTLMLHHSIQPEKVFESIKSVLKKKGKAMIVDLCEHDFKEFRTEMGDFHLGFKTDNIYAMAERYFPIVKVERMEGVRCSSSGRSAEIFLAAMQNGP